MEPERSRVLLVAPQPFYEDRGTPIAIRHVLQALTQLSYRVDVLTYPVGRSIEIPGVRYFRAANPFGVRRVPIGLSLAKLTLDVTLVPALARRLSTGCYRCVHAVEEAAFPAVVLGRRAGVPVIYDMQSSLPEQLGQWAALRGRAAQRLLSRLERWLLTHADSVVSSAGLAERVRSLAPGIRAREWHFPSSPHAPAGHDVRALRAALAIPRDSPVILYSGTFAQYQGVPDLLAAIPRVCDWVPEAVFVLVGADDEALRSLGRTRLNGALRVVRRQPRETLPAYLALADILVSPRMHGANLPLKVFDYLATGKPILATDIVAHRCVLDEHRALLVPPGPEHLAHGILELLKNAELAARLGAAGRAYLTERFGWSAFVQSVAELYGELDGVHARAA